VENDKVLSTALGHLLDFTPLGWSVMVALLVVAVFAWIFGSRIFTRWLLHKALVLFVVILVVRALARMFLNE
jgi:hypothetical protein